jgi:flagellar motor switch protein FliM
MEKNLSQEEIDPRIPFPPPEGAGKAAPGATIMPGVKIYDFKRPDKFSKEQIISAQYIHETFSRLSTTTLSAALRTLINIHVASVDQLTYEEFIRSMPTPTTIAVFSMDPLKGQAALEIDPSVSFTIIDRLFGGPGEAPSFNRELTDIERSVMEGVIVRLLGNLRESWWQVLDLRPRLTQIETNPQFAQIVPPSEMIVLVTLETNISGVEGMMNFCLPYMTIEPIVPKMSAKYWYGMVRKPSEPKQMQRLLSHISALDIEAEVYREGAPISLRDIGRLKKGSLVRLPGFERGEAFLRMGDEGLLRLAAEPGHAAWPASYAVASIVKGEDLPDLASPESAPEESAMEGAMKGALAEFGASISETLSGIRQGLGELQRKQDRMADQLAFGGTGQGELEAQAVAERVRPFDFARRADPGLLTSLLSCEHPQTIALVLSYLEPQLASLVLGGLSQELQPTVVKRIATLGGTMPEVVREVERVLDKKLSVAASEEYALAGGLDGAIDILNMASRGVEKLVVESMEKSDPLLAEELKKRMFVFEDIVLVGREACAKVLERVDGESLLRAMKAIPDKVREFIWDCAPKEALAGLKSRFEAIGRIRLHDVEEAQARIVSLIREMEESGEIIIEKPGESLV